VSFLGNFFFLPITQLINYATFQVQFFIRTRMSKEKVDLGNSPIQSRVLFTVQAMKCTSLTLFIVVTFGATARHSSYNFEACGSVGVIPSETHAKHKYNIHYPSAKFYGTTEGKPKKFTANFAFSAQSC